MSTKLSSDILEEQFGPTVLDVVYQDDTRRIIQTRSASDNRILELSYVRFDLSGAHAFAQIHQKVRAGMSMGKAFREAEVQFARETAAVFRSQVPVIFQEKFTTTDMPWITNTNIVVGPTPVHYAAVLEMYHPVVQWPDSLKGQLRPSLNLIKEFEIYLNLT